MLRLRSGGAGQWREVISTTHPPHTLTTFTPHTPTILHVPPRSCPDPLADLAPRLLSSLATCAPSLPGAPWTKHAVACVAALARALGPSLGPHVPTALALLRQLPVAGPHQSRPEALRHCRSGQLQRWLDVFTEVRHPPPPHFMWRHETP